MTEQQRQRRCVFVAGPESSGSMLAAKIIAHVLGVRPYGQWHPPVGWSHSDLPQGHVSDGAHSRAVAAHTDTVCHRSLPYGRDGDTYPDLEQWRRMNADAALRFVLTTRDVSIIDRSKSARFRRPEALCRSNREQSRDWLAQVMRQQLPHFIWSYETLVYLGSDYLQALYRFLGVTSDFVPPDLFDGNAKYVTGLKTGNPP